MNGTLLGMLGLAVRARACVFGAVACEAKLRSGGIYLMLLDTEASERARKEIAAACAYRHVPLLMIEPKGALGQACGREANRIVGITEKSFAKQLIELYNIKSGNAEV